MATTSIYRFKSYHTVYKSVIQRWYQFQASRFKFDEQEFILINNRNMDIVYHLFLENEGEIMKQIPKVQLMLKVLYLVESTPHSYE